MVSGWASSKGQHIAWLFATTAVIAAGIDPATAQQAPEADRVTAAASATYQFNIPAKSLAAAIADVGAASGWRIAYPFTLPANVRSKPISGAMTPPQAVGRLLAGTGLSYRISSAQSIVLVDPKQQAASGGTGGLPAGAIPLDTIDVQGENAWGPVNGIVATRSATGTKTDTPLRETPASISVVTRKEIEERGAQSISDAVRNTPGVVTETAGADVRYDSMVVRGFTPDTYLNGLLLPSGYSGTGHGIPNIEPYGLERIEILRGSAGALYGQVPAGGILNLVSKRPTETPFHEIQLQTGLPARGEVAFDVGGPVTEDKTLPRLERHAASWLLPITYIAMRR